MIFIILYGDVAFLQWHRVVSPLLLTSQGRSMKKDSTKKQYATEIFKKLAVLSVISRSKPKNKEDPHWFSVIGFLRVVEGHCHLD